MKGYRLEMIDGEYKEKVEYQKLENKSKTLYGLTSIFQTIFARELDNNGYIHDKNTLIGMFEYDVVVHGKKHQKYFPFLDVDLQNPHVIKGQYITQEQWKNIKQTKIF